MAKKKLGKSIDVLAGILLVIGGLVHFGQAFGYFAVNEWAGFVPFLPKVIYIVIGVSAVWAIFRGITGKYMK